MPTPKSLIIRLVGAQVGFKLEMHFEYQIHLAAGRRETIVIIDSET